jgi:TatD DNase family protein
MFDTHAHINFNRFKGKEADVITRANDAGVHSILIPGTDITSSKKAIEIAQAHNNIYASVGIHPHHVFQESGIKDNELRVAEIEQLLLEPCVVAVGEIGMDRHVYRKTKYENYTVDEQFITLQRELLIAQLKLATKHDKSVILHNREATDDILAILNEHWDSHFEGRTVFHCCEANNELLAFAKQHNIFIGVDGDITYSKEKQSFIAEVPLELLVVETDSPFLLPEPLRSEKKYPNEPKNLPIVIEAVARARNTDVQSLQEATTQNAKQLFRIE